MAKHQTQKRTVEGKRRTVARKAARAAKYAVRELDLATLGISA